MLGRLVVLMVGLLLAGLADARMYQWVDPAIRSVQMSGTPPSWYRSSWAGPRVRVFENGRIIDDTAITLSEEENEALRDEAFRQFDEEQELQALRRLEKDALKQAAREEVAQESATTQGEEPEAGTFQVPDAITDETIDEKIEELKDLISEWDRLKLPLTESE